MFFVKELVLPQSKVAYTVQEPEVEVLLYWTCICLVFVPPIILAPVPE